jgi:hypothetical protein
MSLKWILFNVSTFFGLILSAYLQSKRDENGRRRGLFHPRFKELRGNKPGGGGIRAETVNQFLLLFSGERSEIWPNFGKGLNFPGCLV